MLSLLGMLLAPIVTFLIVLLSFYIKVFISIHMEDGWLKTQLLRERWQSAASKSNSRIWGTGQGFS